MPSPSLRGRFFMELPRRPAGDVLLAPGEMTAIRQRLRGLASRHDLSTVIACAFDHRTRILPFIYADLRMVPAGVRAIGSALADSGFSKTRIVLQQWNRNFSPSQMRLDGRIPDLFLVSSMHLHSAECDRLIQDANRIDPAQRPLIIAGGPRIIYEPWQVFSDDANNPWGADVAVTGEEYVLLNLLEVLLSMRARNESLRAAFLRARQRGPWTRSRGWSTAVPQRPMVPAKNWSTRAFNVCWETWTNCRIRCSVTSCWNRPARPPPWGRTPCRPTASASTASSRPLS